MLVAYEFASNRLVSVEDITEDELKALQKFYKNIALLTKDEISIEESHSNANLHSNHIKKFSNKKLIQK